MLQSCGCTYVLCGHSERRVLFQDDDTTINKKVRKVLDAGMSPILCIGESKEEYEAGLNKEVCTRIAVPCDIACCWWICSVTNQIAFAPSPLPRFAQFSLAGT
jgi:hypothetical protein